MPLSAGDRLGPYEVIAPLGAGGMGEVYRARDTRLGREVAIKVLPELMARDPRALERFELEGKAVAALSHPLAEIARDYALEGKLPEARLALQDLLKRSRTSYSSAYGIATVYAALGDKDRAFAQLEQAWSQRTQFMDFLKVDPELDSLRSDYAVSESAGPLAPEVNLSGRSYE